MKKGNERSIVKNFADFFFSKTQYENVSVDNYFRDS